MEEIAGTENGSGFSCPECCVGKAQLCSITRPSLMQPCAAVLLSCVRPACSGGGDDPAYWTTLLPSLC